MTAILLPPMNAKSWRDIIPDNGISGLPGHRVSTSDISIFNLNQKEGQHILVGLVGSQSYGTNTAESDYDYMGVAVAPLSHYTGLNHWEDDGTLKIDKRATHNAELTEFEIRKFMKLAKGFNPNVIPLLYLREQDYILKTAGGEMLTECRDAFVSKRAYATMIGYSRSQRKAVYNGDTGKLGEKRKQLVKVYGYDVKYAMHTVRILRTAIEFFTTGVFNVYRSEDRDELLDIRSGKWTLKQWLDEVDHLLELAEKAEREGNLPEKPNEEVINALTMDLVERYAIIDRPNVVLQW
jgi:uncharacterized protein